jgi:23S rRNA pseudouridine1911/1915/1917 synthase
VRPEPQVAVDVVWADDDVVVVDKPAGLAVHPPAGDPARGGTLMSGLLDRFPEIAALADDSCRERPGIVHRIDRGTSGLLVVARTPVALASLRGQIAAHSTDRVYAALVAGAFEATSGAVDAPIGRRSGHRTMSVTADGRPSTSRYRVEAAWDRPEVTAVSVELETGRTHQIRVHMRAIGHPVVGDQPYGGRMLLGATRQMLHAHRLAFTHPRTGDRCSFVSPLPADLRAVLARAGTPVSGEIPAAWTSPDGEGGSDD